jgi:Tol biopolymer transport system component
MAQRFDEKRLALDGEPVPLAKSAGPFSVSQQRLVYRPISAQGTAPSGTQQIVWIDRTGKPDPSTVMPVMPGILGSLRLSPDGNRLAVDQTDGGNTDVAVIDLDRRIPNRLTFDLAVDRFARWSPDGKRIVFGSARSGLYRMFIRPSVSLGTDQPLDSETPAGMQDFPHDWSLDDKYIVFVRRGGPPATDIWVKPMFGDRKPFLFVPSKRYIHGNPRLSRNSRWLAYDTNESGPYDIVVKRFPDPNGTELKVTAGGGIYPTWRGDGSELYYLTLEGKLMAVSVKEDGDKLVFGDPKPLFQSPLTGTNLGVGVPDRYDVTADGKRFVFIVDSTTNPTSPNDSDKLSVFLSWTTTLKKK